MVKTPLNMTTKGIRIPSYVVISFACHSIPWFLWLIFRLSAPDNPSTTKY